MKSGGVSSESVRKYRSDVEHHVLPYIGNEKIAGLTETRLRRLFDVDLATIGPSARWHVFTNLNAMLNHATKRQILERNPLTLVEKPKKRVAVADDEEAKVNQHIATMQGLLPWLRERDNTLRRWYPLILFMALGLRRAELLGVGEDGITDDPWNKTIHRLEVRQQLARQRRSRSSAAGTSNQKPRRASVSSRSHERG